MLRISILQVRDAEVAAKTMTNKAPQLNLTSEGGPVQ